MMRSILILSVLGCLSLNLQAGDAVDVREEYVTGLMDPSREAALVEKQNVIRKNIGKKKLWQLKAVRVPVFKKATSKLEAKH